MSEQIGQPLQQAAGQAATPFGAGASGAPVNPAPEASQQQDTPLTMDKVKAMIDAAQAETIRQAQSLVDKSSSRIDKRVAEVRAQVGQLSPEQETNLRQELAKEEAPAPTSAPGTAQQPAQASEAGTGNPVLDTAFEMMKEANLTIEETDPEFKSIDMKAGPRQFLDQVAKAIDAKALRLKAISSPAARNPIGGAVTPAGSPDMTTRQMLSRGISDAFKR